ncbi:hypothetical protein BVRB_8g181190 [Beta vulgaris subsp. vulgaris]|nr:hypothetical protein BVRB_8g181190 [Beta vulgaris subsp. vulgaris]
MACCSKIKVQKKKAFRRKLHILRDLINSNSNKTSSIIIDAFLYISTLTLKLEELKRESMNHMKKHIHHQLPLLDVHVEKQGENGFKLNVTSEKGKDNLVHILEAFEDMGINVINARVSCNTHFAMEATLEVNTHHVDDNVDYKVIDPSVLTQVVLKAIERSGSS